MQDIYKIKLWNLTLRELFLLRSIYVCKTYSQVVDIVTMQPNPKIFYKSCLDLNGSNMISMLSFDSRTISHLLSD